MSEKSYTIVQLVLVSMAFACISTSLIGSIVIHGLQSWQWAFVVMWGLMACGLKWAIEEYKEAKNKD